MPECQRRKEYEAFNLIGYGCFFNGNLSVCGPSAGYG